MAKKKTWTERSIEYIRTVPDVALLDRFLRAIQVDRSAIQNQKKGMIQARSSWLSSSPLNWEEDVEAEKNELLSELLPGEEQLKELDLIEDAINTRKQELLKKKKP